MVNNGFCCLYAYFAVMQRNTAKTSDMSKLYMRLPFCYSCSYRFGELIVHALLCYSFVFPDLGTFFSPTPSIKEKPSGDFRVSSVRWRAVVTLLEQRRVDSLSGRLCSVFWFIVGVKVWSPWKLNTMHFSSLGTDKWTFTNHN